MIKNEEYSANKKGYDKKTRIYIDVEMEYLV